MYAKAASPALCPILLLEARRLLQVWLPISASQPTRKAKPVRKRVLHSPGRLHEVPVVRTETRQERRTGAGAKEERPDREPHWRQIQIMASGLHRTLQVDLATHLRQLAVALRPDELPLSGAAFL